MEQTQVKNLGEAISVFLQVANLAQAKGILTLDDAVVVKSAVDFINSMQKQSEVAQEEAVEGPKG